MSPEMRSQAGMAKQTRGRRLGWLVDWLVGWLVGWLAGWLNAAVVA
jgi:hypothetical protein